VVVREHITGPKDSSARFVRALMRVAAGEAASEKQG
jgi:hypothetical protein